MPFNIITPLKTGNIGFYSLSSIDSHTLPCRVFDYLESFNPPQFTPFGHITFHCWQRGASTNGRILDM